MERKLERIGEKQSMPEGKIGLVLEGGGTRGAYTSGVLEVFLRENLVFPTVYGISAGACNALSYISGQRERNFSIFYQYITDERYLSIASLYRTGSLFGFDFIFGQLFHELLPFNYEAFFSSPIELKAGATDLQTGKTVFFRKSEMDEELTPIRASSSLPFVSPIVSYKGYELLDGGCGMPIPLEESIADGNCRHVIVLTRDISYKKRPRPEFPRAVLRAKYGDYPNFVQTMLERSLVYNRELELCRKMEKDESAVVIRPSKPLAVSRYEKNPENLKDIYELGVRDARNKLPQILALLEKA